MSRYPILLLIALWVCAVDARDDEAAWQTTGRQRMEALSAEVSAAIQGGDYARAEAAGKEGLAIARSVFGPDSPEVADGADRIGFVYLAQASFVEADSYYRRGLAIRESAFGREGPELFPSLIYLAVLNDARGRGDEAGELYRRAREISAKAVGASGAVFGDIAVETTLNGLATLYQNQGRYEEAEALVRRALAISEKSPGPDSLSVAKSLNNLAMVHYARGRYSEAEPLFKRSLAIFEKTLSPEDPNVATSLNNLGELYRSQGRYAEAEPLFKRALTVMEKARGPEHLDVATSVNNLALLYFVRGRYIDAEPLYKRALTILEKALDAEHPSTAMSLNNLAELYRLQGRYAEAEPLFKRALTVMEKARGPEHPDVATSVNNLALLYFVRGRYIDAEPLYKRALTILEKALGAEHPSTAMSLNNLAELYRLQGRYAEAEPLYRRALAIDEKALGSKHPTVALIVGNLAALYKSQERYADAEPLYKRSLAIYEKALGTEHPSTATSLRQLADLYQLQGRYAEAEPLYQRALAIGEKALGPEHPDVALIVGYMAQLYQLQDRHAEAERLYKRALAIGEKVLGPGHRHPLMARALDGLAATYEAQNALERALEFARRSTSIGRLRALEAGTAHSGGPESEQRSHRYMFARHVRIARKLLDKDPDMEHLIVPESFEIGQLARVSSAGQTVARMAARFAAGDDALASLVRRRQDTLDQWRATDAALLKSAGELPEKRDVDKEDRLRRELDALESRLARLDATLGNDFPEYTELVDPKPVTLTEVQSLLKKDEALLGYLVDSEDSVLWVVRKDKAAMLRLDMGKEALENRVRLLRQRLDPTVVEDLDSLERFPMTLAYGLYQTVFEPAESVLAGVRHVLVVPDGPLQSLPLGVLVAGEPKARIRDLKELRDVPWLTKKYAFTTIPSVSSLRALRRFAKGSPAPRPFAGFGDPLLDGGEEGPRGMDVVALFARGAVADVDEVRALARLPDTADELRAVARLLDARTADLHLGKAATERTVKGMDLRPYRNIAFATHGIMAGDFEGLAEPALVLTPPDTGTEEDDGLLTASEVSQLELNADWVILSACNTAAPDGTPGAQGLSGLAKAFFYAGSRALLVSHWAVSSEATVTLITGMFEALKRDSGIGRAEALRRSMLALMKSDEKPYLAHPMFWAAFVVVGEGGAG